MGSDILQAVAEHLTAAGLVLHGGIQADGRLHRCGTEGKPKGTDGAYCVHLDDPASVWWQNWQTDDSGTWTATADRDMNDAERQALRQRIEVAKAEAAAERAKRQAAAAKLAASVWNAAPPAPADHPYLVKKHVPSLGLRLAKDGRLLVPVLDASGKVVSLQFIAGDGGKLFLKDGRTAGGFFSIPAKGGGKDGPLVIAEGYATAASIHAATGYAVLVAFNAGNLRAVAEMARGKYPDREIILAADYDAPFDQYPAPGGVGLAKATEAARAVNGLLAVPRREGCDKLDWNDLAVKMGAGEVATQFQTRRKPDPAPMPEQAAKADGRERLPDGFSLRTTGPRPGLWHTEVKEGADPVETWIGSPLHVLGKTRDENSNAWGLLLSWEDADGVAHSWAMPKELLVGRDAGAWLGRLVSEGWDCAPGMRARNLAASYLSTYRTERRARCVPRTGWHHGAFVLPDAVYYARNLVGRVGHVGRPYGEADLQASDNQKAMSDMSDGERIVLQVQTAHNPFHTAGMLEGWRDTVGAWARGNSRLMLAVCAAFAAPLLELCGMESGGFNFTGQSSTGKTTGLVAAASVWGKGASSGGYVQNWRATSNGLEGMAALCSDALLCLDEIGQAPGRTIQEAAYMLANGMGKGRAFQDGSMRAAKSWRLLVLSTGEVGLAEKIREEGGRVKAGQAVRLIDVPADAGAGMGIFEELHGFASPQAFADALKRAAATDYGHAARAFIGKVQEQREEAQKGLSGFLDRGLAEYCPSDADGQVRRVARRFLLCAAAGEMAADWGLLPWGKGESLQAVRTCFDAWLALRGGVGAAEDAAIVEQVMFFLEQHGQSRFQDVDRPDAMCVNRVGFRQAMEGGTAYSILPESFKAEVCKGHDAKRAAAVLLERGILLPGEGRNLMRKPSAPLPGYGRKRCYVLAVKEEA
jgi:putative DNA primase/helicase